MPGTDDYHVCEPPPGEWECKSSADELYVSLDVRGRPEDDYYEVTFRVNFCPWCGWKAPITDKTDSHLF
jgi:hypothetical protein